MLITLREAEMRTGVSRATVLKHINSGTIPGVKEKNRYLIDECYLDKLPKPRKTAKNQHIPAEKVEVPKGVPFSELEPLRLELMKQRLEVLKQIETNRAREWEELRA